MGLGFGPQSKDRKLDQEVKISHREESDITRHSGTFIRKLKMKRYFVKAGFCS